MKKSTSGSAHVIIIVVLAVALIAALGYMFWSNVINKKTVAEAASYAECVKATGSKIQTTYPEICVTTSGKSFTNPDQKVAASDKPATKSFCAPIEKICFDYPDNWSVKQDSVDVDNDSVAERISVNDETGHAWLSLQTGMSGLGGACGDDDGSYAKILQTHTTAVKGSYLVNEATKNYASDTVYAVSWIAYNGTAKNWWASMALSNSNATQNVGKVDGCDVMFNYLNGKNAAWSSSASEPGAMEFRYNINSGTEETYNTEAEAAAFLNGSNAKKAYAVLQSVSYK